MSRHVRKAKNFVVDPRVFAIVHIYRRQLHKSHRIPFILVPLRLMAAAEARTVADGRGNDQNDTQPNVFWFWYRLLENACTFLKFSILL